VQHKELPAAPARDLPARQQTVRAAIAWSHDLLDAPGRALFARLAVFVGGFRLEEAEVVCGPSSDLGAEVLDCLAALVDQSLVTARHLDGSVRYGMLDAIREYAAERLAEHDDRLEIQRRHALAYLALAETNGPAVRTRRRRAVVPLFAAESDNLQAAVRWSIETDEAEIGLRLAAALLNYWNVEGQIAERQSTILAILDIPDADLPSQSRMRALEAAGSLFYYSGENDRAGVLFQAQLDLARELDDRQGTTDAQFNLAWTEDWRSRPAEAETRLEQLATAFRGLGDERSLARIELLRGLVLLLSEDQDQARRVLEQAMARFHELDDVVHEVVAASMIGGTYLMQGDQKRAAGSFIKVFVAARELGDVVSLTGMLPFQAMAALELGRPESAAVILGAFDTHSRLLGVRSPQGLDQFIAAYDPRGRAAAALDPDAFDSATRRGREMTLDEAVAYVLEMARPLM
jgi:tetratricopeptide (TPR) repeat protein